MEIIVNGEPCRIPGPLSVAHLLLRFELAAPRVAVEVNEQLVRRCDFEHHALVAGDRVEIVTLVGGG